MSDDQQKASISSIKKPSKTEVLESRINNLEACIAKMAHYNGGNNQKICREFGIELWTPDKKSMSKHG